MILDEAIKHAEELADYDCYNEKQLKCAEEYRQLAEWLKELKQLREQTRWIPVTEKRPVEFEKVLVTYRLHYDNSIHVGIGNIIANDVNGRYHWNINEQDYIGWDMLAWMPLPEAYKGGE